MTDSNFSSPYEEGILSSGGTTVALDSELPYDPIVMAELDRIVKIALGLTMGLLVPILVFGIIGNSLSFHILLKTARFSSTYTYLASLSVMDSIFLISSIGKLPILHFIYIFWICFYKSLRIGTHKSNDILVA